MSASRLIGASVPPLDPMGTLLANMPPDGLADSRKVHPFFAPSKTDSSKHNSEIDRQAQGILRETSNVGTGGKANGGVEDDEDGRTKKRQKTTSNVPEDEAQTPGTTKARNEQRLTGVYAGPSIIDSLKSVSRHDQNAMPGAKSGPVPSTNPCPFPAPVAMPDVHGLINPTQTSPGNLASEMKPKKVLKFNPQTGTICSPPKPKPDPPGKSRGAAKGRPTPKSKRDSFIVCIKYAKDEESRQRIGQKIQNILNSPSKPPTGTDKKTPPKRPRGRPSKANLAKQKEAEAKQPPSQPTNATKSSPPPPAPRQTIFSSTPCSPKKSRPAAKSRNFPQFGMKSMGLRIPGAAHPAWPAKGMSHVTGIPDALPLVSNPKESLGISKRKSKGRPTNIPLQESIIQRECDGLQIPELESMPQDETDGFGTPPPQLRVPMKHFESGRKLQDRIRSELKTPLPLIGTKDDGNSDDDEILPASRRAPHAAVARLYKTLSTNLSAFDKSECEDSCWAHKYSPDTAEEVLQSGREAGMLRDWLEALKVQSVDTGNTAEQKFASTLKAGSGATKPKRKRGKLDDFIVGSDEEMNDLDEITDPEDDSSPVPGQPKQTVVQNGGNIAKNPKETARLANAALLSGPHGSGKTATIYAIAKELGFEIFEINASSRRSGKDIMDRVGDMTRNHLVQRHQEDGRQDSDNTNTAMNGPSDQTAQDVKSGKQGTMMSFFKQKATTKPKADPKPAPTPAPAAPTEDAETPKASQPKAQKQSLILLEEVDVLYEEDKQFWTTVNTMIVQSKRPFIMTCNDESTVPFQTLNLHGIFRFSPPPEELAVDVLLLIAANEGHALRRRAVSGLLESRGGDLRAALADLNYWCQLGVGDRRGGFDWFYPRWPRGCDKDENGDVVRVISEDTYLEGMAWLGRDAALGATLGAEEELLLQCWQGLHMDLGHWHKTLDMASWVEPLTQGPATAKSDKLAALNLYDQFSEAMSCSDLCSNDLFGAGTQEKLDPSQPDIPVKARDDYILGRKLLEAPVLVDYDATSTSVSISLRSKAREIVSATHASRHWPPPTSMHRIGFPDAVAKIRNHVAPSLEKPPITRYDMALAFDPIAVSERQTLAPASYLDPSVFDRTMRMITLDVAPYVRGIVLHDRRLADERAQRGTLLSEGARPGKRLRQTRTALSAGEGAGMRRESYFRAKLNPHLVMRTAGNGWDEAVSGELRNRGVPIDVASMNLPLQDAQTGLPGEDVVERGVGGAIVEALNGTNGPDAF